MGAAAPLIAIQAGMGLLSSYTQSKALKEEGKAEEKLSDQNARLLELQAEDAVIRGAREASEAKRKARAIKGSQRAGYAGQNVDVSTGTAAAIQAETDAISAYDALTIQNNAFREAWGYRTEATNERFKGKMARLSSKTQARNTLLTGGLTAAKDIAMGSYMANQFKNTGGKTTGSESVSVPKYMQNRSTSSNKLRLF